MNMYIARDLIQSKWLVMVGNAMMYYRTYVLSMVNTCSGYKKLIALFRD